MEASKPGNTYAGADPVLFTKSRIVPHLISRSKDMPASLSVVPVCSTPYHTGSGTSPNARQMHSREGWINT
jgi:hypothetical protein